VDVFEVVVALLLGGVALAAVARRIGAPYPALAALAGAALALVPRLPMQGDDTPASLQPYEHRTMLKPDVKYRFAIDMASLRSE
jgi:hypothetical protein